MRRVVAFLVLPLAALSARAGAEPTARFPEVSTEAPAPAPSPEVRTAAPPAPSPSATPPSPAVQALRSGAELLADRGRRFEEEQRFTEAIAAYSESIKLDSSRGETVLALAKLRARLGDPNEAELLLTTAARYRSVAAEALTLRSRLRKAQGRDREAASDLEIAARIAPDDTSRTEELSALYVARGAWLPALSLWRRAAASERGDERDHRTKLKVRALTLLAAELDPVIAGGAPGYSWTRHALARLAVR